MILTEEAAEEDLGGGLHTVGEGLPLGQRVLGVYHPRRNGYDLPAKTCRLTNNFRTKLESGHLEINMPECLRSERLEAALSVRQPDARRKERHGIADGIEQDADARDGDFPTSEAVGDDQIGSMREGGNQLGNIRRGAASLLARAV